MLFLIDRAYKVWVFGIVDLKVVNLVGDFDLFSYHYVKFYIIGPRQFEKPKYGQLYFLDSDEGKD